jgi:methyl-accepting chemotaxis protein
MGQTPGGIYAPQTAIQSAGMAEGTPQVRPSSTIKSYGSHSGTNPTQRFLEQQTDTNHKLTSAIGDMSNMSKEVAANMAEMKKVLESLVAPMDKAKDKFKDWVAEVKDVVDGVTEVEDTIGEMYRQVQKVSRLKIQDPKDIKIIVDGLETIKDEITSITKMKIIDPKSTKASTKLLEDINTALVEIKENTEDVGKASASFDKLRSGIKDTKKELGGLSFKNQTDSIQDFGKTATSALGGLLGNLRILDGMALKGFMGRTVGIARAFKSFKEESKRAKGERQSRFGDVLQKNFVSKGHLSPQEAQSLLSKKSTDAGSLGLTYGRMKTLEEKDKLVRALSGRTDTTDSSASSWFDRKMTQFSLHRAGVNALKGTEGGGVMGSLLAKGEGSALAGVAETLGTVSKALRGPLMVLSAGLEAWETVAGRKKDTYEALGKGGLIAGNVSPKEMYAQMSQQLTPGLMSAGGKEIGFDTATRLLGMSYDRNLGLMKHAVDYGVNVGVPEQNAVQALNGPRSGKAANTVYSGMMRNAYMFGGNVGLNDQESISTMMKMIHEFNQSIEGTEDFFINMDKAVKATGISTTKYLALIDQITSQFDKFNKSLNNTVAVIQLLGKNSKYTAEYMQNMMKGLTGEKKSMETNAYLIQQMTPEQREGLVGSQEQTAKYLGGKLKEHGFDAKLEDIDLRKSLNKFAEENKDQHPEDVKARTEEVEQFIDARKRARTMRENINNPIGFSATIENMGENLQSRIATQMSGLSKTIQLSGGGGISDLMDSRKASKLNQAMFGAVGKTLGVDPATAQKMMGTAAHEIASRVDEAMNATGDHQKELADALGTDVETLNRIKLQAGGKGVEGIAGTKDFENILVKMGGVWATQVSEDERKADAQKAIDNKKQITGPLEQVTQLLTGLLDNLKLVLQTLVDYFYKDERKGAKEAKNWQTGLMNYDKNGVSQTAPYRESLISKAQEEIKTSYGGDKTKLEAISSINEFMKWFETAQKPGKEAAEAYSKVINSLASGYNPGVVATPETIAYWKNFLEESKRVEARNKTISPESATATTGDAAAQEVIDAQAEKKKTKDTADAAAQAATDAAQKSKADKAADVSIQAMGLISPLSSSSLEKIDLSSPKTVVFNQYNSAEVVTGTTVASQPTHKGGETSFPSPFSPQGVK